jgi:acyl carrier protein
MFSREELEEKLRAIVADLLTVNEIDIQEHSDFVNDLQADSLDAVELIMLVEDEFNITVEDQEAEQAVNFRLLVNLVESKLE